MIDPLLKDLDSWKLVIPLEDREKVLKEVHEPPLAGHFGKAKTYSLLARHYYWVGMRVDAAKLVRSCKECQLNKPPNTGPAGLMYEKTYNQPWHVVSVDLQDPFPRSKNQFSYLFVAQDIFTKFVLVKPIRIGDAKNVWKALPEKVFYTYGFPKTLRTDNGREFANKVIEDGCRATV